MGGRSRSTRRQISSPRPWISSEAACKIHGWLFPVRRESLGKSATQCSDQRSGLQSYFTLLSLLVIFLFSSLRVESPTSPLHFVGYIAVMWSRFITSFLLASFVSLAACASFESIVEMDSDLTTLSYYLKLYPDLLSQLNNSRDITFLAPSNDAIQGALSDQGSQYSQGKIYGWIDDIISYHTLNGTVGSANISETPHFARSWLNDSTWTSVSGGQVVGYVYENGKPTFTSGIQTHTGIKKAVRDLATGVAFMAEASRTLPLMVASFTSLMAFLKCL